MKKHFILAFIAALLSTLPAFALRFESGENVRISQPVNEDIYIFSGTIYIEAPVYGDIWCAGGTVTVSDTVTGDIVAHLFASTSGSDSDWIVKLIDVYPTRLRPHHLLVAIDDLPERRLEF